MGLIPPPDISNTLFSLCIFVSAEIYKSNYTDSSFSLVVLTSTTNSSTKLFPRLREYVVKDGDDDDGAAVLSYRLKLKTILSRDSRFQYNVQCIYQELPKLSRT